MTRLMTALVVAGLIQATPLAQTRLTEAEARAFADEAATKANGKEKDFNKYFRDLVRTRLPKYSGKPVLPARIYGLGVLVEGQITAFQRLAADQIRTFRPVSEAPWPQTPILSIAPTMLTTTRIERAVVRRGTNTIIEPIENRLIETDAKNLSGAVFKTRAGWLSFPFDAFAPGEKIQIILIPESGRNIEPLVYAKGLDAIYQW